MISPDEAKQIDCDLPLEPEWELQWNEKSPLRIQLYEIYLVRIEYRLCQDIRPCIVIAPPSKDLVKIARISSALDLYNQGLDFWLDSTSDEFLQTGLKRLPTFHAKSFLK